MKFVVKKRGGIRLGSVAFTIIEVMIALFIFALIMTAIYTTWMGIVKGTKSGLRAAAEAQRARVTMRALEDAFMTVVMYNENMKHYWFVTDTSGDFGSVSMVSRLPGSFPGVARYGEQRVRRVSFYTKPGDGGGQELIMTQVPTLLATNNTGAEPYSLVLARDVSLFKLEFWDLQKNDWADEWLYTNALPRMVRVTLGLGKAAGSYAKPDDVVTRVVAIPAAAVAGVQAGPPMSPSPLNTNQLRGIPVRPR